MSASNPDHLGRRVRPRFVEVDLVVWRGANVCAMCGATMARDSRDPCCHATLFAVDPGYGETATFEWVDDAEDVRVIAQWQTNGADFDHPVAMVRYSNFYGRVSFEAPFHLTAEEWAEAERRRDQRQIEAHHG